MPLGVGQLRTIQRPKIAIWRRTNMTVSRDTYIEIQDGIDLNRN